MRVLLFALLLATACTERVNLDPDRGGGDGGVSGSGGHSGSGGGSGSGGAGGGSLDWPCGPGEFCAHEGAVCSDNVCALGPSGATMARCMCVRWRSDDDTVWACSHVWCSDAGTVRYCPSEGEQCSPDVLADCCWNGQIRYCLCPGSGPNEFTWQCRTISAPCPP